MPSGTLQAGAVAGDVWLAEGDSRVWEWVSSATAFERGFRNFVSGEIFFCVSGY